MDRTVRIVGVPTDYGANRRGVDMGPSALRYAGLADELEAAGIDCADDGDLPVPPSDSGSDDGDSRARFRPQIRRVTEDLAAAVGDAVDAGECPLVLGGDHSVAIGTLRGTARDASVGVVWFDAHGDFNTPETTPSGNVHGMSLAAALGVGAFDGGDWDWDWDWARAPGLAAENVAYVGLRDLDPAERAAIRDSDVTAYTMSDVDERGVTAVVEDALDVATGGTDAIHVSLDLDFLDPIEAPGVGTPVRGGATYREAHQALERVAARHESADVLRSLELVEVNPILDERNGTAELACELAASGLGKRIL
ncbi:MAG: arginase [Halobacteriaceae archaeon]